ncbi:hypothetical protein V7S43_014032 [Phytophthora oleae]|uniref:Sulfite reductase [NADPH] flavoprotein alpha-component-like FAD-binding domain-containing protein n=1 Tax=Phytophthora oleae TaxID=2107226 RepID=A0ABD3F5Q3_9STRA
MDADLVVLPVAHKKKGEAAMLPSEEMLTYSHLISHDEHKRSVDETVAFAELLEELPSARPSQVDLLTLVPRIKSRHYSIASIMKLNPTSVHLLIVVHDWTTASGKYCIGQATRFLSGVKFGQKLSVSVCSSVMKQRDGRPGYGRGSVARIHPGVCVLAFAGREGGCTSAAVPVRRRVGRIRGRWFGDVTSVRILA